jgi:hypothetical protein
MLRYLAKEKRTDRSENFKKQESMISKQGGMLPDTVNTIIPSSEHKECEGVREDRLEERE